MGRGATVPNGVLLSAAIAEELKIRKSTPDAEELRVILLEHHPDWKIPERRVKKFLKRYLAKHADLAGADDDATMATVGSRGERKGLFGIGLFGSKRSLKKEENVVPESVPKQAPTPEPVEEEKEDQIVDEPEPVAEAEENAFGKYKAYEDDNSGKKKDDCYCFEGCIVM